MGTTVRQRRHIRTAVPDDDLVRILSDQPAEHDFSIFCYTDADLERAWREHGAAIVAGWVRHSPGTRPSFWWMHDAPEPRRQLSGDGEAESDRAYAFGLPCYFDGDGEFETQHAYLKRLKLLLPREGAPIHEPHPTAPPEREFWQVYLCRTS